jgi:hypothetical protein
MAEREVRIRLTAADVGASATVNNVAKAVDDLAAKGERTGKGNLLDSLKATLGGRSDLKDVIEILRAGGPIAAVGFGLRAANDFTEAAIKLKDAFKSGKMDAGELIDSLARGVPVLGQAYELGRNIRELLTGEEADQRRLLKIDQERLGILKDRLVSLRDAMKHAANIPELGAAFNDTMAVRTTDAEFRPMAQAAADLNAKTRSIQAFYAEKIRVDPGHRDQYLKLQGEELAEYARQYDVLVRQLDKERIEQHLRDARQASLEEIRDREAQQKRLNEQDEIALQAEDRRKKQNLASLVEANREQKRREEEYARLSRPQYADLSEQRSGSGQIDLIKQVLGNGQDPNRETAKQTAAIAKSNEVANTLLQQIVQLLSSGGSDTAIPVK